MSKQYKIPVLGTGDINKLAGFTADNAITQFLPAQLSSLSQLAGQDKILVQQDSESTIAGAKFSTLVEALNIPAAERETYNYSLFQSIYAPDATPFSNTNSVWMTLRLNYAAPYNAFGELSNSLGSFILPAGYYYIRVTAMSHDQAKRQRLRLTSTSVSLLGQNCSQPVSGETYTFPAFLSGVFTIEDEEVFNLEYWSESTQLGLAYNIFDQLSWRAMPYVTVELWRFDDASALPYIMFYDQKAYSTNGGSTAANTWYVRDLNSSMGTCVDITLDSNALTFQPGTYVCRILCPCYYVAGNYGTLAYLGTAATQIVKGMQVTGTSCVGMPRIIGKFTVESESTYSIYHFSKVARANDGLGTPCYNEVDMPEIYTTAEFWQLD